MQFPTSHRQNTLARVIGQSIAGSLLIGSAALAHAEVGNPRVNQVGYLPNGEKIATYVSDSEVAETWRLYRDGELVDQGNTVPIGTDAASGDNVHQLGFTDVTEEGDGYVLMIGADESYPFSISADNFTAPMYDALKYFYHNRSGIEIETQYTGGGNTSYEPSAEWSRPAGHINQGVNQGDYDVPCWEGTCNYSLDVIKGWYDAGDHGKYVVNGGISAWKLLNMYERAQYLGDNEARFADGALNIPESGNGIPDLLDEVRWQMEFLLSMQVPEGEAKAGMAHHKMHDVGWTGLPLAPHEDSSQRALVPPSVTATLNLAATAAQCARIWDGIDDSFASQCLSAAERAWDAAQANPDDIYTGGYDNGGGAYGDEVAADEFYWAAAELYITTGDERYLPTLNNYELERTDWGWPDTELPGVMSLATVPAAHTQALRADAQQHIINVADSHLGTIDSTGYRIPNTDEEFYWGSNNVIANKLFLLGLAYDFTGNDQYARGVNFGIDYLFGRNTLSFSFVSGHGEDALTEPHHRFWAGALDGSYPWLPPGALAGGPNDGLEDSVSAAALGGCEANPATCYIDDIEAWSTNEITINWNSGLAWVLAFHDDYAEGGSSASSSSVSSSSAVSSSASSVASSVSSSVSSRISSSAASSVSSSEPTTGQQCNWYGTLYELCDNTASGWGWENNQSCISPSTCESQPEPYGIVGGSVSSSSQAQSSSSEAGESSSIASSVASSAVSSVASSAASSAPAGESQCEFVISNEWSDGYTAAIRISNEGSQAINGWSVSWNFTDGASLTNSWNAQVSGSNPYTATDMGWNGTVQPGQSVEFGFQVSKGSGGSAEVPEVTGDVCD
ncbi:glycoside hydrolase family 9 protein [Marinimicrobium agarilyticum]|uniref:glycoside hydrolase family 9 protein n=1 Tax=Marinimicrobium agarilyticum TaxID=306546 RepID=UPI0004276F54|nr:glycoside hydrolase family 9 protein [Marinimicrobium agarilyticum]